MVRFLGRAGDFTQRDTGMSKITIEDISRHTGLSRGTVSRALNDRPDISEQTKQRVLEACRHLKYTPSHAARSLATGRRYAVAVVVDNLRSTYAACFLRGVVACAQTQRYAVHVTELGAEPETALNHVRTLLNERVDAVLIATPLPADFTSGIAEALGNRPVLASDPLTGIGCDVMAPDHAESGRLAARHILRNGATNILYVHDVGFEGATQRTAGFHEICRASGIDPQGITVEIPATTSAGAAAWEPVRARLGDVAAAAASDDFLALQLMMLCRQVGRLPGRDIAVMGQGNEVAGARLTPTLTTVDPCGEEVGRRAMEVALQRVTKARQDSSQVTHVPPMLIARDSTRS